MRRHPSLHAWGREHHAALSLARSLREAETPEQRVAARIRLRQLGPVLIAHFADEEARLCALLRTLGRPDWADRLRREHELLRAGLASAADETLQELGQALGEHVRFEDRELYPFLEAKAGDAALQALVSDT